MELLKVRATVHLPPNADGKAPRPGDVFFTDPEVPYIATQLAVGHLVPIGPIPPPATDE